MSKQPIGILVVIPEIYRRISMELGFFLVILIARVKYKLVQNYSYVNLKSWR